MSLQWTIEENEFLKDNSTKDNWKSPDELSILLGKTINSIRVQRLNLSLHPTSRQRHPIGRYKTLISLTCSICGKVYEDVPSQKDRKYCSMECRNKGISKFFQTKREKLFQENSPQLQELFKSGLKDDEMVKRSGLPLGRVVVLRKFLKLYRSKTGGISHKNLERKIIRKCLNCEQTFEVFPSNRSKFCSQDCWFEWKRKRALQTHQKVKRICKYCGKEFEVLPFSTMEYCSRTCWHYSQSRAKVKKTCEECGTSFIVSDCRKNQRFCSKECFWNFAHENKKENSEKKCEVCGKLFKGKCPAVTEKRRFCSPECANISHRKNQGTKKIDICLHLKEEPMKFLQSKLNRSAYLRGLIDADMKK